MDLRSIIIMVLVTVSVVSAVNLYNEFNYNHRGSGHSSYCTYYSGCYPPRCNSIKEYSSSIKRLVIVLIPLLSGIVSMALISSQKEAIKPRWNEASFSHWFMAGIVISLTAIATYLIYGLL